MSVLYPKRTDLFPWRTMSIRVRSARERWNWNHPEDKGRADTYVDVESMVRLLLEQKNFGEVSFMELRAELDRVKSVTLFESDDILSYEWM